MKRALTAEFLKLKNATIVWVTFLAFAIAPVMGGLFMLILNDQGASEQASVLSTKAQMMDFSTNLNSYLNLLTMAIGVGGVLIFGFVASWIFGREYADGMVKDLLALPTSRTAILHAKFCVYVIWCLALTLSNLIIGALISIVLQIPPTSWAEIPSQFITYGITTLFTVIIGTPIAFFAIWTKGYLGPLGFVVMALVLSQIIAATGYGGYFPWSIPGLYSGIAEGSREQLDIFSYLVVVLTGIIGYIATLLYWKWADQYA